MQIVHVVRQYWPSIGGLEEFVARLCAEQRANGLNPSVVTLNRPFKGPRRKLPATDLHEGTEVVRIPYWGSTRYPLAPAILGKLDRADLIHVHAVDFFFDFLAATQVMHRRPLVATTHGGFFHTDAHARLKRVWFNTVTRRTASAYRAVVACSRADFESFSKIAPSNLVLIENGVDIAKFAGAARETPAKKLVTIGRFSANKRLDRLLDAMRALVALDNEWRLHIVGAQSDWTLQDVTAAINARSLAREVTAHVGLTNDQMRDVIGDASLFVSASEYEGFGMALVEALSAGLTPIVHANATFRGFEATHGFIRLADFANARASAAAIQQAFAELLEKPTETRQRAIALGKNFSWPDVAARYTDVYRKILSGSANAPPAIRSERPHVS
ncbi:MAG: glycosyltransferase family 4 protein [Methylocystis sp.]|nr:glycosyltransferase family 4 protein [Methylocystis sp.]